MCTVLWHTGGNCQVNLSFLRFQPFLMGHFVQNLVHAEHSEVVWVWVMSGPVLEGHRTLLVSIILQRSNIWDSPWSAHSFILKYCKQAWFEHWSLLCLPRNDNWVPWFAPLVPGCAQVQQSPKAQYQPRLKLHPREDGAVSWSLQGLLELCPLKFPQHLTGVMCCVTKSLSLDINSFQTIFSPPISINFLQSFKNK
jgi:hypothetical protein